MSVHTALYRERGLAVSLFRLLSQHHPSSMVMLDEQYRMNRYIIHVHIIHSIIYCMYVHVRIYIHTDHDHTQSETLFAA